MTWSCCDQTKSVGFSYADRCLAPSRTYVSDFPLRIATYQASRWPWQVGNWNRTYCAWILSRSHLSVPCRSSTLSTFAETHRKNLILDITPTSAELRIAPSGLYSPRFLFCPCAFSWGSPICAAWNDPINVSPSIFPHIVRDHPSCPLLLSDP